MMDRITYHDLVTRFGTASAFDLLLKLEKLAAISSDTICFEEEQRLQRALDAINQFDFAA